MTNSSSLAGKGTAAGPGPDPTDVVPAFAEHDRVALVRDVPGLAGGAVGTVVGVYGNGGFEVEFTAPDGRTPVVVTLAADDLRPTTDDKLAQALAEADALFAAEKNGVELPPDDESRISMPGLDESEVVEVRLTRGVYVRLVDVAGERGVEVQDVIRAAVTIYLSDLGG